MLRAQKIFDHQGYVPYLIRRVADGLTESFMVGLRAHGISLTAWRVLAVLDRRGPTRFGVLASQTLIEPPTLSRLISTLEEKELATRASSGVDGRGVLIAPTAAGLDLIKELTPHAMQVEEATLAGLTDDEVEMFRRLLRRVCANVAPFAPDDAGRD